MKINMITFIALVLISIRSFAATEFNMTCASFSAGGGYSPQNVVAIWVSQTNGTIVKTILRYGEQRKTKLTTWFAADGTSVDGKMGATRSNHSAPALVATWDLKDKSGAVVPDGTYKINFEFSEDNGNKTHVYNFVKNGTAGTLTDSGNAYFKNISITYAPPAPVNTAPVAQAQSVTNAEDTAKAITLSATDAESNTLTYAIATSPSHGTLSGTPPSITYAPATNYYGADSFTFTASDASLTSTPATVSITVTPVNDAPVAQNQSVTNVVEDVAKLITLVATDVETNALTYAVVTAPSFGTLSAITSTNQITYTPATNYYGTDSFTFRANDASLTSTPAPVSITVTPVNDAPVAQAQNPTATDGNPLSITLNATDAETNAVTYSLVSQPVNGHLLGTPPSLTYVPVRGLNGSDSFTFNATDGTATGNTAAVSISLVFIDSNSNGIPDSWQSAYGVTDANADPDGDGESNYAEYMAGTDPTNKTSVFAVSLPQVTGGSNMVIKWSSVQYRFYTVQASSNLTGGWGTLISNNIATPPLNVYTAMVNQARSSFYRVRLEP